jgi:RNA polymerase sigma-70 factor (ECF subfamily)
MNTTAGCQQQEPSDETLLRLIHQKDMSAFAVLYERYAAVVFTVLVRLVRDPSVAEELQQETFWHVWQKAAQYGGTGLVVAWLLRIARNQALDELRRQNARPRAGWEARDALKHLPLHWYPNTEREIEQRWLHQHVAWALDQIPAPQRQCLELIYFDGLSQREIAERTHTPLGTIKTRVRCGLAKVERLLRGAGYSKVCRSPGIVR